MTKLLTILKQIPLRFRLRRLEKKINGGWDRNISLRIDSVLARLEESR